MMPVALKSRMSRNNLRQSKDGTRMSKKALTKSTSYMQIQPMSFEEKCRRYRAIFDSIDVDGSGTLDPEELAQAVVALGMEEDQVSEVFGVSGEASLTFDEFVTQMEAYEQKLSDELAQEEAEEDSDDSMEGANIPSIDIATANAYRRLFGELDVRRAGHLTAEDLHNYIRNLSLRQASMSSEELNFLFALVEEADTSPEGYIDIEGFADVAELHQDFMESYKKKGVAPLNFSRNSKYFSTGSAMSEFSVTQDVGDETLQAYRKVFNEFDRNNNGKVSDEDVTAMMNRLGRVPTEEESEFLFELLQLVGEDGFTFEEFVELMHEGPEGIADLGKSVSTWKNRQTHQQQVRSKKLVKANVSRMGLRTAIQRENSRIQARNSATLERINNRLSRDAIKEKPDGFGAGFSFMPTTASSVGAGASQVGTSSVPMYPAPAAAASGSMGGLGFASAMLTPLELLRYQAVFNALDLDKDGRVSFSEMTLSTKGVTGRQPSDTEVREFLQDADSDKNGTVEFEEFVVIMQRTKRAMSRMSVPNPEFAQAATQRKMEKYRTVFDSFDLNRDGVITPDEFKATLEKLGRPANDRAIQNMFNTYDKSRSGGLRFEEFVPLLDQMVAKEMSL